MRRVALLAAVGLALGLAPAAGAVPLHIHSVTTPGGTQEFGGGVSLNAPCVAFLNLHENVHLGAFAGTNPNTVTVEFIEGECP